MHVFLLQVTRPNSPHLNQQRMLREVLLKAVENLRKNQRRLQTDEEEHDQEEIHLPSRPQETQSNEKRAKVIELGDGENRIPTNYESVPVSESEENQQDHKHNKTLQGKSTKFVFFCLTKIKHIIKETINVLGTT